MGDCRRYAGFWIRLAAVIIDLIVTGIILIPLWIWFSRGLVGPQSATYVLGYSIVVVPLVCLLVTFLYHAGFWTWRGQTPGKMVAGIRVIRTNGDPLSFSRAALRYLGYILCCYTMYLGFVVVALHKQKRGLHDIIADTCVLLKAIESK